MHSANGLHEHEDHEDQGIGYAHPVSNWFGEKLLSRAIGADIPKERRRNVY